MNHKTKIIATIGPASNNFEVLKKMKSKGMNIARINTKYGNPKQWESMITHLTKLNVKILIDIKGVKAIPWINKTKNVDYVAISYARDYKHVEQIKKSVRKNVKIISKIETITGIKNINGIINNSHGLMIGRGDLSRNIAFEKVPYYKRTIIDKCVQKKKFVVTATEMLLSMVNSIKPTNAEVDDIFSSVLAKSSALMLSEETAIGKHPALCVETMRKIIREAEKYEYR